MMNKLYNLFTPVYETNDLDAFVPELWANESVAILLENMVAANLVHRDFEDEVQEFGDVVNTRQPAAFEGKRKGDSDSVTIQNSTATNIQVPLNQHFHVSFLIRDGQESKAFKDLVAEYLEPAVSAIAQSIDKVVLGQHGQFMANNAGGLGETTSSNAKEAIIDLRSKMNANKAYSFGRNLILGSTLEGTILKDDSFTDASKVGDEGTALREASLGRKLGFNIFMAQNMSEFTNADTNTADDIDGALDAGATDLTVTSGADIAVGDMITVEGDMTPQRVTGVDSTIITVTPGLRDSVEDAAAVTIYDSCLVDYGSDYDTGHYDEIHLDGWASNKEPSVGQQIVIDGYTYTIIDTDINAAATEGDVLLDRPLESDIADDDVVSLYPTGNYGFAFHRNAMALVTRPLAQPRAGTGALSGVANYEGLGIRVVITYDGDKQGHLVTVDLLCGVKVLDTNLGAILLG